MAGRISKYTATIANAGSLSNAFPQGDGALVAIELPSAWTAAALSFDVSNDNVTYKSLSWSGSEFTISDPSAGTSILGTALSVDPAIFQGYRYIKIRSGTVGTPVAQGGARTLYAIISRDVNHGS